MATRGLRRVRLGRHGVHHDDAITQAMAHCTALYQIWWNYEQDPVCLHTGQRARAELALYRCQNGRYDEGIAELEELVRRGGFRIPDA